ncbi:MAG: aminotransferase class I/II-fold pyridoxal phosphate-dependent enzyme [Thermomicrobiales bacterium]
MTATITRFDPSILHPETSPHERAPVIELVRQTRDRQTISFSCPGHKGGNGVDDELRQVLGEAVFQSDLWLNQRDFTVALRAAEALAAHAWGASAAHFLVNGSSSGNIAVLQAMLAPDETVIISRDAHRSMISALIATGARPVYLAPRLDAHWDIGAGIAPDDVARALEQHPGARAVVLTSPTYCGVHSDIEAIAEIVHSHDLPLVVDQAWGAHLAFHQALPKCAIAAGADVVVVSPHKTLGAFSQGAMVLAQGARIDMDRLKSSVEMTQSTSRNVPLLMSLDAARRQMALRGHQLLDRTLASAAEARALLRAIPGVQIIDAVSLGLPDWKFDATRLVIDTTGFEMSGYAVEHHLRHEFGIAPEMSDARGIVCLITIGDTPATILALVEAISRLATRGRGHRLVDHGSVPRSRGVSGCARSTGAAIQPGDLVLTPREAYFSDSRLVAAEDAVGGIVAEMVVPYPPGIPVVMPGERLTRAKLRYLQQVVEDGGHCAGVSDSSLRTLRIVDRPVSVDSR